MARFYLLARSVAPSQPCRFDVVAVTPDGDHWHIELIKNAFTA